MRVLFAQRPGQPCRDDELPLDALLACADALTLHVPLTPDTRGLIGTEALARMKPNAVIINTGRVGNQEVPHLHIHIVGGPDPVGPMLKRI